ncbi:MAG: hypothetical protein JRN15_04860 [Nitrososphaerota archaeon]|nr:hypothetical protein [Nitrososphaerota archaeon]
MTSNDVYNLITDLLNRYNLGLTRSQLDGVIIDYDNGDSDGLIARNQNLSVGQVDATINAVQAISDSGSGADAEATSLLTDHIASAGSTKTSVTGFAGWLGTLTTGAVPTVSTTPGATGGINISSASPGSGTGSQIMIILIAIAAILALFVLLKLVEEF